ARADRRTPVDSGRKCTHDAFTVGYPHARGVAAVTSLAMERREPSMPDQQLTSPAHNRSAWEPMALSYVGHIADILRFGDGKLSVTGGDPGEPKKQKGHGG